MRGLPICCAAAMTVLSSGTALAAECQIFDAAANELIDGQCVLEYDGYAEIMTIGDRRAVFVLSERQGQWAIGTLDGKPAARYEIDRSTFSYATQDLTLFVDRSGE